MICKCVPKHPPPVPSRPTYLLLAMMTNWHLYNEGSLIVSCSTESIVDCCLKTRILLSYEFMDIFWETNPTSRKELTYLISKISHYDRWPPTTWYDCVFQRRLGWGGGGVGWGVECQQTRGFEINNFGQNTCEINNFPTYYLASIYMLLVIIYFRAKWKINNLFLKSTPRKCSGCTLLGIPYILIPCVRMWVRPCKGEGGALQLGVLTHLCMCVYVCVRWDWVGG